MLEDAQGKIWVVHKYAGVLVYDGSGWREIGDFSHDQPVSIFQTSSSQMWIGFELRGAVKYDKGSIKDYPTNILAFFETPDHRLFGGGRGEGLFLYNPQSDQWEPYPPSK